MALHNLKNYEHVWAVIV